MTNDWIDIDPQTRKDTQWTQGLKEAAPTVFGSLISTAASAPSAESGEPVSIPTTPKSAAGTSTSAPTAAGAMSASERKKRPLFSGLLRYFPDALMEVAHCSWVGNEQHNPGEPLHWAKEKSTDEYDALMRHLADVGTRDSDGVRHAAKVAWRALAGLQREIERERNGV